jgi:basic amino acid/polyamine antiporter, APA family
LEGTGADAASVSGVHGVSEVGSSGLFTRQATGLVRQVSPVSTLVFNMLTSPAPFVLAAGIFWAFGAFPGANLYIAFIVGYGLSILFTVGIGLISTALPRSGGDYVLVGRIVHPALGLVSSFCFTAGVLLSIAFFMSAVITLALAPLLTVTGLVGHSTTLVDWGTTLSTSHWWQFWIGVGALLVTSVMAGAGWRWPLRIQNATFILSALGLLIVGIVLLVVGKGEFAHKFNAFAEPTTHNPNTYASIVAHGAKAGVLGGTHWSSTIPAIGAVMGFSMFTWYSIFIAGEVRRASTRQIPVMMVLAGVFNLLSVVIFTAIFYYGFGHSFFASANALNGSNAYPFAAAPTYIFLASIAAGSSVLAWFLGITLMLVIVMMLWLNVLQPVRAMFAWAFDGVFPRQIATVSGRTHVPIVTLVITFVISVGLYVWQVWGGSGFFSVYATGVVFTVVALLLMSVSAIIVAYRRPDIWQAAVTTRKVVGVPVTTIFGVIAFGVAAFMGYLFLHYPGLGVSDPWAAVRNVGILIVVALVTYAIASRLRSSQGLSLTKAVSEIPPE